jgi:hypothetical protein
MSLCRRQSRLYSGKLQICFVAFLFLQGGMAPLGHSVSDQLKREEEHQDLLKLNFSTDKSVYKIGEAIFVLQNRENIGNKPLYIDPEVPLAGVGSSVDGFAIDVFDPEGKRLPVGGLEGLFTGYHPDIDVVGTIQRDWIVLRPGYFYGSRQQLHLDSFKPLTKPGRYKLVATYWQRTVGWLGHGHPQAGLLKTLPHPVWDGEVSSEPVWIEILE